MKYYNFTPGPTPIPRDVNVKMAEPILSHRSAKFSQLLAEVTEGLKFLFQTQGDVLTLTASGTGAMEAAVVNLFSQGDRVAVIRGGKFGGRWAEICVAYGVQVVPIDVDWGYAVDPQQVADLLDHNPDITALLATHSETSTGVLHDIQALGEITRKRGTLLVVDAISGLGANDLKQDAWHVDAVVTGSQKGLMIPPGLAFISVGPEAWEAAKKSSLPRYYFDLKKAKASLDKGVTPYTPAVSLIMGLGEALQRIRTMGLEALFAHHAELGNAMRAGVQAINLMLFARRPSNVLTAVEIPNDIDGNELLKHIRSAYGVTIANGMEHCRGKVIRIAHLGYDVDTSDLIIALSALERGLAHFGHRFEMGAGVTALQRTLS